VDRETLVTQFGLAHYVVLKNVEGLSHADSLVQPEPGGNCLNWVLGHIVRTRNEALGLVGKKPLLPVEKFELYASTPIQDGSRALPFAQLLRDYEALQQPWIEGLRGMPAQALTGPAPFTPTGNPQETVGSLLVAIVFHESYHSGQLGLLRRLVGKAGVIKPPARAAST